VPEQAEVQFAADCGDLTRQNRASGWSPTESADTLGTLPKPDAPLSRTACCRPAAARGPHAACSASDEIVHYAGTDFCLATHRWASGAVDPQGFLLLEDFHLAGSTPVWTYGASRCASGKTSLDAPGRKHTYIQYNHVRGSSALEMELKALNLPSSIRPILALAAR